ncbi:MAG: COQ9 family protein [Proteobacteria bacterium]|nr:COQ9 family protein [Pseudomonadota bacterium]
MTDAPSARFRTRILNAFIDHASRQGWTDAAFQAAVEDAGLTAGEAALACPRGAADLFDAFADRADQAMLRALDDLDLASMRYTQRVKAAVQVRLQAQAPYKDAARAMSRALARPTRAPEAARLLWRTADRIWRYLGDTSTDENYYSKRAILTGVLASTYARWFSDDSADQEATWAFLDARLANVMQFEKFKARLKPLSEGVQSAVGVAARFRYGGR